jgi:hypothetical protein
MHTFQIWKVRMSGASGETASGQLKLSAQDEYCGMIIPGRNSLS